MFGTNGAKIFAGWTSLHLFVVQCLPLWWLCFGESYVIVLEVFKAGAGDCSPVGVLGTGESPRWGEGGGGWEAEAGG